MNTLYLIPSEMQRFGELPASLTEGWLTKDEQQKFTDTKTKLEVRLALVRIHDPHLKSFIDKAKESGSASEIAAMVASMNLKGIDDDDLATLFFAMGPDVLSAAIRHLLRLATTDTDVEGVAALTVIRHEILASYQPV